MLESIWFIMLYLGSLGVLGHTARERGLVDWHWWIVGTIVFFGSYGIIHFAVRYWAIDGDTIPETSFELSRLGIIGAIICIVILQSILWRYDSSKDEIDKIDQIGNSPNT